MIQTKIYVIFIIVKNPVYTILINVGNVRQYQIIDLDL